MQKWEIKRLFIPTKLRIDSPSDATQIRIPVWADTSNEKWSEAEALAVEGWEPVGIAQVISGHEFAMMNFGGSGSSYTEGYILIFKRPIQ